MKTLRHEGKLLPVSQDHRYNMNMINSMASLSSTDSHCYYLAPADTFTVLPTTTECEVLTMLVMEAAGAGEDAFPLCPGAGDFATRCCLWRDRESREALLLAQNQRQHCQEPMQS